MNGDSEEPFGQGWDEYDWEQYLKKMDREQEAEFGPWDDSDLTSDIWAMEEEWEDFLAEDEPDDEELMDPLEEDTHELFLLLRKQLNASEFFQDDEKANEILHEALAVNFNLDNIQCSKGMQEAAMTVAYLKRALRGVNALLGYLHELNETGVLSEGKVRETRERIFSIRDRIVTRMGECRTKGRRGNR